ncbi:MAG: hypothetical protein LBJ46_00370 [Planctomycetota bacterium]|jgi:hypothetical protein|nr:hypothetical protein [Planctomycetota bacterium]
METDRYLITLINLGIIFFPGIIGTFLLMRFRPCKRRTLPYFFLYSYVIGIVAFACVPVVGFGHDGPIVFSLPSLNYFLELGKGNWTFLQGNVFSATVWAIIAVVVFSVAEKYRVITFLASKFRISNRFEDDIWNYTHNLLIKSKWVKLTDHKEQLVYVGTLEAFSDTFRDAELMLTNVYVFDINTYGALQEPMCIIPNLYITLDPQNIKIEFH